MYTPRISGAPDSSSRRDKGDGCARSQVLGGHKFGCDFSLGRWDTSVSPSREVNSTMWIVLPSYSSYWCLHVVFMVFRG